jgi:citrate lyase beta subunit
MFNGGDSRLVIHSEESYRVTKERIAKAQKMLDAANAVNEQGKQNYDHMANDLKRRIQEGEQAKYVSYLCVKLHIH